MQDSEHKSNKRNDGALGVTLEMMMQQMLLLQTVLHYSEEHVPKTLISASCSDH